MRARLLPGQTLAQEVLGNASHQLGRHNWEGRIRLSEGGVWYDECKRCRRSIMVMPGSADVVGSGAGTVCYTPKTDRTLIDAMKDKLNRGEIHWPTLEEP